MDYFPLFLKLKKQSCLVVGAGTIATRKIELLSRAGAVITVIAKDVSPTITHMQKSHELIIKEKEFETSDVKGFSLIVSATNNSATNQLVSQSATELNIPVNVVDNPELCSFIFPAIIDRSPLIVAVSSGGASPVLARLLRAKIESIIPSAYGQLALFAEKFRNTVKKQIKQPAQRRILWESALQGKISELIFAGRQQEAESLLKKLISNSENNDDIGEVYLVGAGPGDPDLLTFRALRLMQQADVVVYDRLVSPEILDLTRRDSEKIYVGKQNQNHSVPQDSINELLASLAKKGKRVVRLKGGDPFIFGRGGEEIDLLSVNNIPFQIVPGITAASGCASYAGIPLTHRDYAQSCIFITGHLKDGSTNLNWPALVQPQQTLAVYMGTHGLDVLSRELIKHGMLETTPAAIVQQGTTSEQCVYITTVKELPLIPKQHDVKPPSMIIIGEVVSLHEKLAWFETVESTN
jgi:uroporphyrin-III C-methyltransferase/precorrin-2 dehydrogenase/sirohydrochlorin ferrochelatase